MKNYKLWVKTAAVFQFITMLMHAVTLFISPAPANDTEKQLFGLMSNYQFDFGAGFHRTMDEMTLALSACLCLLCLLAGLINFYLVKRVSADIMRSIININLLVFGIFLVLTVRFTFIFPIMQAGLIVSFLLFARLSIPIDDQKEIDVSP